MSREVRICVLDGYTLNPGDNPWDDLARLGELTIYDRTRPEEIVARAAGFEVVLTNKTRLDGQTLAQLPQLRFVSVLATGVNVIDLDAARRLGVAVSNVPVYGTDSVAQHTWALILALAQGVVEHDAAIRAGEWQRCPDFSFWHDAPVELAGRMLGIVGFGRIGRRVAELGSAFGMKILATGGRRP
ncbi:MAG TPA: NAD(P)-dependent oxidoreductase, partial [Terriglobales bacterium]|nr:NAD(P)-dependent oxidoreductase [Terriglobales bacterium]